MKYIDSDGNKSIPQDSTESNTQKKNPVLTFPIPKTEWIKNIPPEFRNGEFNISVIKITNHGKTLEVKFNDMIHHTSIMSTITIPLSGYWDEFDKPELSSRFDLEFLVDRHYIDEQRELIQNVKAKLLEVIGNYFSTDTMGINIVETLRTRTKRLTEKQERADAPRADVIIRDTSEHILAKYHIVTVEETGQMLYYDSGVYLEGAEAKIKQECEYMFQYDTSNFIVREIIGHIQRRRMVKREEFDSNVHIVNFKNCYYDWWNDKIIEHTPDYLSINQKPVNYIPNKKPKLWGKFVGQVLYASQVRTMVELFAYTYYRRNEHELFANQNGWGNNGKTVMMGVLKALHGQKNSSNIPFRTLMDDRFAASDLEGKDVNVDEETPTGKFIDITKLKKLTGNHPTWVQKKGKPGYEVVLHTKHFLTSNELPDFTDMSDGRFRREILIVYPHKFVRKPNPNNPEERKEDPYLERKLTTEDELEGIASMCMRVLRRIMLQQNMGIHTDISSIEERRKHRELLKNPTKVFIEEAIESYSAESDNIVFKDDLYAIYTHFCQLNKVPPFATSRFGEKIKELLRYPSVLRDGREAKPAPGQKTRRRYWEGLNIKPEWMNLDGKQQSSLFTEDKEDIEGKEDNQIEENTECNSRPGRPGQSEKSTPIEVEKSEKNPISSDISRSDSEKITSDTTNLPSQNEVKNESVLDSLDAIPLHKNVVEESTGFNIQCPYCEHKPLEKDFEHHLEYSDEPGHPNSYSSSTKEEVRTLSLIK